MVNYQSVISCCLGEDQIFAVAEEQQDNQTMDQKGNGQSYDKEELYLLTILTT